MKNHENNQPKKAGVIARIKKYADEEPTHFAFWLLGLSALSFVLGALMLTGGSML